MKLTELKPNPNNHKTIKNNTFVIMKRLILFSAILLLSCKKEETTPLCDCKEVTYYRQATNHPWSEISSSTTTKMDCWRHGQINDEWMFNDPLTLKPQMYKKQIVCE